MSDSHEPPITFLAPELAQLAPLFPGYELESLIATGGMGAVYCAVQKSLDRPVAIKILPREFSRDAAFCAGFEAEAKAMARLNHPNLIGVYDFGEVDGMMFIIMELVPGKSLFHSAHGIAIDAGEVIRLVTGICDGLAHTHAHGIIHRDIKPSNILLDLNAQPKIGDFGLAHRAGRKIEEGEEIFGTPHYTAPEVVDAPQSVNHRTDIFSVGVLLHELLTGRLPDADRRPASTIIRCDIRFDAIIRRATNPVPELRYTSAAEIAEDLRAIAVSSGPKIMQTPARTGTNRPASGRPIGATPAKNFPVVPLIVVFSLVIVITVAVIYYFSRPQESSSVASNEDPATAPHENPIIPLVKPNPIPVPEAPWAETKREPQPDPIPNPPPELKPELKPDPMPELKPEPMPDPPPVTEQPSPDPKPDPVVATQPKFDVAGFFVRARKIIKDRAAPLIAKCDANIKKNIVFFDRDASREIRKIRSDWQQERDKRELEIYIKECKKNGNRIPGIPVHPEDDDYPRGKDLKEIRQEFIAKQQAIDDLLMQEVSGLSATYILGLDKQIERLKTSQDAAAITLITEEVDSVRNNPDYFQNQVLGIAPANKEPQPANANPPDDR